MFYRCSGEEEEVVDREDEDMVGLKQHQTHGHHFTAVWELKTNTDCECVFVEMRDKKASTHVKGLGFVYVCVCVKGVDDTMAKRFSSLLYMKLILKYFFFLNDKQKKMLII